MLGTVPGIVGTLMASEALKTIVGFGRTLDGRLLTLDLKNINIDIIDL